MSTMAETRTKRRRRSYSDEFKAGAVRLVLDEGRRVCGGGAGSDVTNRRCAPGWSRRGRIGQVEKQG